MIKTNKTINNHQGPIKHWRIFDFPVIMDQNTRNGFLPPSTIDADTPAFVWQPSSLGCYKYNNNNARRRTVPVA
jgi:hypothetical protein